MLYQNACYIFEIKDENILYLIKDISRFKVEPPAKTTTSLLANGKQPMREVTPSRRKARLERFFYSDIPQTQSLNSLITCEKWQIRRTVARILSRDQHVCKE